MRNNTEPSSPAADLLSRLLREARALGADAADALYVRSSDVQAACRKGRPEHIERSESAGIGLRVWAGARQAAASSSDLSPQGLSELAGRAVAMARAATEDPDSSLADPALLAREIPALDLCDAEAPPEGWLMEQARATEAAALSVPGITNSEGGEASYGESEMALATLPAGGGEGFAGGYRTSYFSLSASVLAGEGVAMERDYDYTTARHRENLLAPESIGRSAAKRALQRLNPRKVATCEAPIVFDPRVSRSLIGSFAGAINGASVARGTSFLKQAMGTRVFAPGIRITDDPHRPRGLGSRPFDAEGVRTSARAVVEDGILTGWLLDTRSARKLGLSSTGHASRGLSSPSSPSTSNFYLEAGTETPQALISGIQSGFYVTEAFGMGVNLVTGDYSQGASGFWIENGEIAYPVSEVTIAGHLRDMMATLLPANDLEFRYALNAPTVLIPRMTVAGA